MNSAIKNAAQLLECVADLQMSAISPTEWLDKMTALTQCEAICVISWTSGQPDTAIAHHSSHPIQFERRWLAWVDNLLQQSNPEAPAMLEHIAKAAGLDDTSANSPLNDPKLLIAFLDDKPATTLILFRANTRLDGWADDDRENLSEMLPALRKAHLVHKRIVENDDQLDIANNALDGIPRAIITMTPTAEIIKLNNAARELVESDLFGVKKGKLTISHARVWQQFQDKLAEMRVLTPDSLNQFTWNRSFSSHMDGQNYQLILRSFMLKSWRLESSSHDRFAELIIGSLDTRVTPNTDQLRDFYDLSGAQARVVVALLEGNDIMTSSAKLHISINTIRSHMRAIYQKMGVDNQRDLLRVLSSTLVNYSSRK